MFESRDPEGAELRDFTERRVRFAMRRLAWLAPRARVQLDDVNGPRGGVDKRCRIELRPDGARPLVITAVARHWHGALDRALARAARSLVELLRRRRRGGLRLQAVALGR